MILDLGAIRIADFCSGTFARVWLARLSPPHEQDKNKVFALKILRKVDGMFLPVFRAAIH